MVHTYLHRAYGRDAKAVICMDPYVTAVGVLLLLGLSTVVGLVEGSAQRRARGRLHGERSEPRRRQGGDPDRTKG